MLKQTVTISEKRADFLPALIALFIKNNPGLKMLESVSPGDDEYTGYPIYSDPSKISWGSGGNGASHPEEHIVLSGGIQDFSMPVYFLGTSVDNVVLMVTIMGHWLSFSMCHSLSTARKIKQIFTGKNTDKICPLTNIIRGSQNTSNINQQGLVYYTYKVRLAVSTDSSDTSKDILKISIQYISSDFTNCYKFEPELTDSSDNITYYEGNEQFAVIFSKTEDGLACALNLYENLAYRENYIYHFYPFGQLLYFSFNEPVEVSDRLYGVVDPWSDTTSRITDEDLYNLQWNEYTPWWSDDRLRWRGFQYYQRMGMKHLIPANIDVFGPERGLLTPDGETYLGDGKSVSRRINERYIKIGEPNILPNYSRVYTGDTGDDTLRIMPGPFFMTPKLGKGQAYTRRLYVPGSQDKGYLYLCYIPSLSDDTMPQSGNIYKIGDKKFMCIYPGMCGLFARVG